MSRHIKILAIKDNGERTVYWSIKATAEAFDCAISTIYKALNKGLPIYNNRNRERYTLDIWEE